MESMNEYSRPRGWFAWRPVRTDDRGVVWMRFVWVRTWTSHGVFGTLTRRVYRVDL